MIYVPPCIHRPLMNIFPHLLLVLFSFVTDMRINIHILYHNTQCLSPERREVTGESSNHTGKVWQQEAAEEPPQDHASDQEETKDKESSSEANRRAD